MQEIVLKIDKQHIEALGAVRCVDGLKLATDEHFIWLRGIWYTEMMDSRLQQLPVLQSYFTNDKDLLFLHGELTPVLQLPAFLWQDLRDYMKVELPQSSLPGKTNQQISLDLIPSATIKQTVGLLTTLQYWKQFAETASAIRIESLQFAVSANDEVMIIGSPLPAIPGKEYWQLHDLLIPSGSEPVIGIAAKYFSQQMSQNSESFLMYSPDGQWQQIDKTNFVSARRSGIRLSGATGSAQQ